MKNVQRVALIRRLVLVAAGAVLLSSLTVASPAAGQDLSGGDPRSHRVGDLFPSYWAPLQPGSISAPLYVAPVPTPAYVGHTWVTYQPLYPHEFLYPHSKVYWRNNPQGGWTRTKVSWW